MQDKNALVPLFTGRTRQMACCLSHIVNIISSHVSEIHHISIHVCACFLNLLSDIVAQRFTDVEALRRRCWVLKRHGLLDDSLGDMSGRA